MTAPKEIPYLEAAQVLRQEADHIRDFQPCPPDCRWHDPKRYHKCTSCSRNRNHPDNYQPSQKPPEETEVGP